MIARIHGVRLSGLAAAVPAQIVENSSLSLFDDQERAKIIQTTGIHRRRRAPDTLCTSDLCFEAAIDLLGSTGVSIADVGLIIFVSQTPDYVLPATSIVLAGRLGASKDCAAFDVNLGCSGYTHGLWQASSLLKTTGASKALLLVGDVLTPIVSDEDRSSIALFGDCGTATLLEIDAAAPPMVFDLGSDGAGAEYLIVEAGGFRRRPTPEAQHRRPGKDGHLRAATELFMDGPQVFNFALREVPKSVKAVADAAGWQVAEVDGVIFHQANKFMLDYLAKRSGVVPAAMKFSIEDFGNTSSATIPLTMVTTLADALEGKANRFIASGFGVGWSWASCAFEAGPIPRPTLREV